MIFLRLAILLSISLYINEKSFRFSALNGCWFSEHGRNVLYECWTAKDGGYKGSGCEINAKKDTVFSGSMSMKQINGIWYYSPQSKKAKSNPTVRFHCVIQNPNKMIFENRLNEYPQQISIELLENSRYRTTIAGKINGKYREESFVFKRIKKP
ncbi:MAG: DUF6265 family protein [Bacteroidota bacterium]